MAPWTKTRADSSVSVKRKSTMKDYYKKSELAPYLQEIPPERRSSHGNADADVLASPRAPSTVGEGDAAAGSMLKKVSSLSLLRGSPTPPRPPEPPKPESPVPSEPTSDSDVQPTWRMKERLRTAGIGLVMSLNVGTDPPDVIKPHPCARLQCWMDPLSISRAKAKEAIGERLEAQYVRWQPQRAPVPVRYRRALDPTVEEVRALCLWLRKQARSERVLLHYNGHGVPRPTNTGEIWVFDKNHTQYIPLCVTDLRQWMGKPSIVVLDCSSAGVLVPLLTAPLEETPPSTPPSVSPSSSTFSSPDMEAAASQMVRDTIVLCATSDQEWLPMHPEYPADIFTSCLTTPIEMALRFFIRCNPQSMGNLSPDAVDFVPGKAKDRNTPLGELHWIFAAVTDCIAWNVLPKSLFQRLFRQDHLLAGLMRNYLLADRILRTLNCTPQTYPPLPPGVNNHPLWEAWDLACETCLSGLMQDGILGNHVLTQAQEKVEKTEDESAGADATDDGTSTDNPDSVITGPVSSLPSPFFSEQLTAFEIWLDFAAMHKVSPGQFEGDDPYEAPEQLPIVLQVMLSPAHRVRALMLLRRFLDLGKWAVNVALCLGIQPYVQKLLQSPEYKRDLVGIWAKIMLFDPSCQAELARDETLPHFINHLNWGMQGPTSQASGSLEEVAHQRTMAAFILAATCLDFPQGQNQCLRFNIQGACNALLSSLEFPTGSEREPDFAAKKSIAEQRVPPLFRMWLCICVGNLVKSNKLAQKEAYAAGLHRRLFARAIDSSPDVRAAAFFAIGCLIGPSIEQPPPNIQQTGQPTVTTNVVSFPGRAGILQPGIIPNRLVGPTIPMTGGVPGQLQPAFAPSEGPGILMRSQQAPMTVVGPGGQGKRLLLPQMAYAGTASVGLPNVGMSAAGFVSRSSGGPQLDLPGAVDPPAPPSIFDDISRMSLDSSATEVLVSASNDASPMVRYEMVASLGCFVDKYLPAFLVEAEESMSHADAFKPDSDFESPESADADTIAELREERTKNREQKLAFAPEVSPDIAARLSAVWEKVRDLQRHDPHPAVSSAANAVVSVVHERLLAIKSRQLDASSMDRFKRISSELHLGIKDGSDAAVISDMPPLYYSASAKAVGDDGCEGLPIRRISSEVNCSGAKSRVDKSKDQTGLSSREIETILCSQVKSKVDFQYHVPKSLFYEWKKNVFGETKGTQEETLLDPVSLDGATIAYRERRNGRAYRECKAIASHFQKLAPKPQRPRRQRYELFEHDVEDDSSNQVDEELSDMKKHLVLKQTGLLSEDGSEPSYLLRFHSYENALVACDRDDGISVWDYEQNSRKLLYHNGNPKGTKITSACWINEMGNSLFMVGCNDGSVRVFDGFFESNGKIGMTTPTLSSAFYAIPDMRVDSRLSGLILEWQQTSGRLIAGGNSSTITCWDLESEKCSSVLETRSEVCITSLDTAWKYFPDDEPKRPPRGGHVIGPDLIVAGQSDGLIKLFDIRASQPHAMAIGDRPSGGKATGELMRYDEHSTWIVDACCTAYGGQYEIVSGSLEDGVVKVFDLRVSASLKTYTVQRSPMTALAVHSQIPVIATGSQAQFIKVMTLDGDTLQVIKNHEEMTRHRIGPVSSIAFHPHKMLLAAGGQDGIVGIYSPQNPFHSHNIQ